MFKKKQNHTIDNIEFRVVYSGRRTLGISVLPDSTVIVRVPYLTSFRTITRVVRQKSEWIIKHRDSYKKNFREKLRRPFKNGEIHLFRGKELPLDIKQSSKNYTKFGLNSIEIGLDQTENEEAVRSLLYRGYKKEAEVLFPLLLKKVADDLNEENFKATGLVIRTMKRRWGSCSNKGLITLSTELIRLPDIYIEYVITHEFCHLKHHNHGAGYYELLAKVFPEWKRVRKELRQYTNL